MIFYEDQGRVNLANYYRIISIKAKLLKKIRYFSICVKRKLKSLQKKYCLWNVHISFYNPLFGKIVRKLSLI